MARNGKGRTIKRVFGSERAPPPKEINAHRIEQRDEDGQLRIEPSLRRAPRER